MKVYIHRDETSQPISYVDVINAYTKGPLYCVLIERNKEQVVHKYPLCSIFRIVESYL